MPLTPVTLRGRRVVLETLTRDLLPEVRAAALSAPQVFRYFPYAITDRTVDFVIDMGMKQLAAGEALPFVTRDGESGAIAGGTTLWLMDAQHRRYEIGGTWLLPRFQRTHVNTEAKLLQFLHAFESLNALRVELKTDSRNLASQRAMERIGAVREGTLRSHMLCHDGHVRDSVYFSVVESEWPAVRARLEAMIAAR